MIGKIKNNTFYRNNLVLFIGTLIGSAFNYFFHFIVGRSVEPAVYGEIESLIALLGIISVPAAAITLIATQVSSAFKAEADERGCFFFLKGLAVRILIYGLPMILILTLFSPYISVFFNIEKYWALDLIWIMMFLSFLLAAVSGVLNGWQKFVSSGVAGVAGAAMKLVSVIIFLAFGYLFMGTLFSFAVGIIVTLAISVFALKFMVHGGSSLSKDEKQIIASRLKEIKRYIWPFILGNLSISLFSNVDMVVAKHNLDPMDAGNYGALMISAKIIFFLTGMISTVLFSMSAEENHKRKSSRRLGIEALKLMLLATGCLTLAYFLFPNFILSLMFGAKYHSVAPYLGWFAVAVSLLAFNNMIFQYLLSVKKIHITYWLGVIASLMTLALMIFGKNLISIIIILAIAQLVSIIAEAICLFKGKYKKIIPDIYGSFRGEN